MSSSHMTLEDYLAACLLLCLHDLSGKPDTLQTAALRFSVEVYELRAKQEGEL